MNNKHSTHSILQQVASGSLTPAEAEKLLQSYTDLGFAKPDFHRAQRKGFPEVIFGEGKTGEQITAIFQQLIARHEKVVATKIRAAKGAYVTERLPAVQYDPVSQTLRYGVEFTSINSRAQTAASQSPLIGIVCAGTSDLSVAEEAALTAVSMGHPIQRFYDVGVAGLHRLLDQLENIKKCRVLIVIAGMEGALPSVLGGLTDQPLIAVPTSIGYGAHFDGLAPLLTMLNSCASGVTVVNINNGFGAAYAASQIIRSAEKRENK